MILKASLITVHSFCYEEALVSSLATCEFIAPEERDDLLPYVRSLIERRVTADEPKAVCLPGQKLTLVHASPKQRSADESMVLSLREGKVYFFKEAVGILTLRFDFPPLEEADFAELMRALTVMTRVNNYLIRPWPAQAKQESEGDGPGLTLAEWMRTPVAPFLGATGEFNLLSRSTARGYAVLSVPKGYLAAPAFVEALLHGRRYRQDEGATRELADSVSCSRLSEHVVTYGNSNGAVYVCQDAGTEFSRNGVFDVYSKNYLVTYLITVYQQVKLQQYLTEASDLIISRHPTQQVKNLKERILTYLARTDFTQISHNPARNTLYKFFRRNLEIRDLLDELSNIIKKIDQEIEAEKSHLHAAKAHTGEKIALILEVLILPYYLHHIVELVLQYFSEDKHFIHLWSFWLTFGATAAVILGIQLLVRAFRPK